MEHAHASLGLRRSLPARFARGGRGGVLFSAARIRDSHRERRLVSVPNLGADGRPAEFSALRNR
eukprot:1531235-Prymnesium_polylepis.1